MTMKNKILVLIAALTLMACPAFSQTLADTIIIWGPGNCGGNVSANFVVGAAAGAGTGLQAVGTNFTPVYQVASSAAATDIISCDITGTSRTTPGKGLNSLAGTVFFYGIVTTTATSENAPICTALSFPTPAAGETASVAAGTNVAVTSVPVIGSANLTAITTGQFYSTYLNFTTPPALNGVFAKLQCSFSFGQAGAAAMVVNTPGGITFTTWTITYLKKHPFEKDVKELMALGIDHRQSEMILASYKIRPMSPRRKQTSRAAYVAAL